MSIFITLARENSKHYTEGRNNRATDLIMSEWS